MTKRTAHALALVLSAMPILIVGCGDGGEKGGTGGSIGGAGGAIKYDGGGGAGGAKVDVGGAEATPPTVDSAPATIDVATLPVDSGPVVDAGIVDAPLAPDAPIQIDTATIDAPKAFDTATVDTYVAIDSPPVCTMTTPFTGGDVTANLTLTKACSPYHITDNIQVTGNATLTIEAGVTLNFESGVELDVGNRDNAKLIAVGTATAIITFTSAAATPSAGDWTGIYFGPNVMGGTQVAYAKVDYCGLSQYACIHAISGVKPGRVVLDHVTIAHVGTGSNGIYEEDPASNFTITNSTFSNIPNQQYAISVLAPSFVGIGGTNTFNGGAMVEIRSGTVSTTTSWVDPGTAIAVTDRVNVGGASSPVLTIGPGMTFKFGAGVEMDIGSPDVGQLIVAGTSAKHVIFTSLAATQAPGDWTGLFVDYAAKAQISYADFSYGGADGATGGNLLLYSPTATASLKVDNSSFSYSLGYGVQLDCTTTTPLPTVQLTNNTYSHNGIDTGNANTEAINVGPGLSCP